MSSVDRNQKVSNCGGISHDQPSRDTIARKDRKKRTETMLNDQIAVIKLIQTHLEKVFKSLELSSTEEEFQRNEKVLAELFEKSEEVIVIVQVLMKLRNELAYARLELEQAVRSRIGVEKAKKRVKWLQERLEKTLLMCRSRYNNLISKKASSAHKVPFKDQISKELWNRLPEEQKQMLCRSEQSLQEDLEKMKDPFPIMDDVVKMLDPLPSEMDTQVGVSPPLSAKMDKVRGDGLNKAPEISPKRKKKRTKVQKHFESALGVKRQDEELFRDGESDTIPEPFSDVDPHSEGNQSDLIISTLDATTMEKPRRSETKDSQSPSHFSFITETDAKDFVHDHVVPQKQCSGYGSEKERSELEEKEETSSELDYWDEEHHRFEWSDFMMSFDPRSWHALGIVVPDSFLNKEKPQFSSELPWREKPKTINSVLDVHKVALDKLLVRLHRMYETVDKVTQATVDPLPKDQKIETVMGKIDAETDTPLDGSGPLTNKEHTERISRAGILPPIQKRETTVLPSVSFTKKTDNTLNCIGDTPSSKLVSKTVNDDKQFPRISKTWCEDPEGWYDMPRLVKSKPKMHKKTSNVQSRYLSRKGNSKFQSDEGWKPSTMLKLIKVARIFESEEKERQRSGLLNYDGPKWKRIEDLLSDIGLASPNTGIATGAAKSLGLLGCRDVAVLEGLRKVLVDRTFEARLCHEASKSLILLGCWDTKALNVIVKNIANGNGEVIAELLTTMTKARDIPFVDKNTPEFQKLSSALAQIVRTGSDELAFKAAVSLGRLCVVDPVAKVYLIRRLPEFNSQQKEEALYVLIKQLNCKTKIVFDALLEQLSTSHNWKHRVEAAELLIFVGAREVLKVMGEDEVFVILERLLWDHANKYVRKKVAQVLSALSLRNTACALVLKRLEDPSEDVRAKAVISLATLEMKGVKEMKALLDILELDPSPYVRIQVVRAFRDLEWNDPRVIRSLKEREKSEGLLAKEATQALHRLVEGPRRTSLLTN